MFVFELKVKGSCFHKAIIIHLSDNRYAETVITPKIIRCQNYSNWTKNSLVWEHLRLRAVMLCKPGLGICICEIFPSTF